jgi:hypothetical protein
VPRRERGLLTSWIAPARRWFCSLGWVPGLFALVGGGCVSDFDRAALDGRPCPCLPGWVCDATQSSVPRCVRQGSELADHLLNASGEVLDAGSAGAAGAAGSNSGSAGTTSSSADAAQAGSGSSEVCPAAAEPIEAACPALCDECLDGTCFIHCNTARQCQGSSGSPATLACPPGFHCAVSCESDDSCSFLKLECPGDYACSTHCMGKKSCTELNLACAGGPCSLTCDNGSQICRGSQLQCGAGACQASCLGNEVPVVTGCAASCSAQCGC